MRELKKSHANFVIPNKLSTNTIKNAPFKCSLRSNIIFLNPAVETQLHYML